MSIYLDNNATTFVDPQVATAIASALLDLPGNPSSLHQWGRAARIALQQSREIVAAYFGVATQEVLFHSGGTEGLNQLFKSLPDGEIISSNVEHSCVHLLLKSRPQVTYLEVGEHGAVTPEKLKQAISHKTKAIVLLAVNNETGIRTDIEGVAQVAAQNGIPLILDGVCWLGKESIKLPDGVSAVVFSAHKFHGPKGVGFTIIRRGFKVLPFILGGPQEQGRRGGTENLPGIIGMAKATTLLDSPSNTEKLRIRFETELLKALPHARINGSGPRVCNTVNIAFEGIDGETLLAKLDLAGVAASHGSACSSGAREPSRILLNMGYSHERVRSSLRFSLSRMTTEDEIERAIKIIIKAASKQ